MFFGDWIGTAIAALMGGARIVAGAIQADPQIGVATVARFTATGLTGQRPFPSAHVTMACHSAAQNNQARTDRNSLKKAVEAQATMQLKKFIKPEISPFESSPSHIKVWEDSVTIFSLKSF